MIYCIISVWCVCVGVLCAQIEENVYEIKENDEKTKINLVIKKSHNSINLKDFALLSSIELIFI